MKNEANKPISLHQANESGPPMDNAIIPENELFQLNRRRFLEAAGFTFSAVALSGCSRPDPELALPFAHQPEGVTPGQKLTYASSCIDFPSGCGMLVTVRDGRPLKMEGMPEHPLSKGGLNAIAQALPLGLYDSHRLKNPLQRGEKAEWKDVDENIQKTLSSIKDSGGAVRVVTPTVTGPTLKASIDSFLKQFKNGSHVIFDTVSHSAILDAHEKTHGVRVLPHYLLANAQVIVSFGADFLGTWISPVEFTADWRTNRVPTEDDPQMSYHVHFEGRVSLTGGKADRRYRLAPDEFGTVLNHLYVMLSEKAGKQVDAAKLGKSPIKEADLASLAQRLWDAKGECILLCDSQDVAVQVVVNAINNLLENYGKTLDITKPSLQAQGNDRDVLKLIDELKAGKIAALFVAGTDLTHNLPEHDNLAEAISKVRLVVSLNERDDDFSSIAHFVCPDHHLLESWLDAEPVSGLVSLSQPLLQPLGNTRSILESLARWSGSNASAYDILRASWEKNILPRSKSKSFRKFWDQSVHDGFVEVSAVAPKVSEFKTDAVNLAPQAKPGEYCLSLYTKVGLTDSRHAHNPWLQELPDPITKVTWDNYVSLSPTTAEKLGVVDGDVVSVEAGGSNVELPALVQRGQHDRVLSIALAYGVKGTDRFAKIGPQWLESRLTVAEGDLVGKNAAPLVSTANGSLSLTRSDVAIAKTDKRHELAKTQEYHSMELPKNVAPYGGEYRDVVESTTLAAYRDDPEAGMHEKHFDTSVQLWPEDHPKKGHQWGMSIDLNTCTGCSACVVACQSENNVPVVGKDEVYRQREMHWMRIDRYIDGEDDDIQVSMQPMMCQHCDNAPCETVCPVLATTHSSEGLNEQVYNRCVGTRYCANNCPYKVRRFNWFQYSHEDSLVNLALNPDVTVRARGVMEKCSMCVQRIEEGKIDAKRRGVQVADGDIQTACQQSCPAKAITFGDVNDSKSKIHTTLDNPRKYGVLEEFNFRQGVSYLRVVRNREEDDSGEGGHSDHEAHKHSEVTPSNSNNLVNLDEKRTSETGGKHV